MQKLLVAALFALSCAMDPNTDARAIPLQMQADLSAIIFVGTVTELHQQLDKSQGIKLVNVRYAHGDGPSTVAVRGFGLTNNFVLPLPELGSEVVIFGCKTSDTNYPVALNDFYNAAGIRTYTGETQAFIDQKYKLKPGSKVFTKFTFGVCRTAPSLPQAIPIRY